MRTESNGPAKMPDQPYVTKMPTMVVIGIILTIVSILFFCWLLFTVTVHALPFFVGVQAGVAAFHNSAGVVGTIVIAIFVCDATLVIGQIAFATIPTSQARAMLGLLYAVPAAIADYHATIGHANLVLPSEGWRAVFTIMGSRHERVHYAR